MSIKSRPPTPRPPRRKSEVLTRSLPHERDEIADTDDQPRPDIETAHRDISEGQVDTDNYTRMRDVGNAGLRKRR
jgi:hypothetical protein